MSNKCSKCLCECHCEVDECPTCPNDVCTECECNEVADKESH